jgi:hypothetical protein
VSATTIVPSLSTTTSVGQLKRAAALLPSAYPESPLPATVLTAPVSSPAHRVVDPVGNQNAPVLVPCQGVVRAISNHDMPGSVNSHADRAAETRGWPLPVHKGRIIIIVVAAPREGGKHPRASAAAACAGQC